MHVSRRLSLLMLAAGGPLGVLGVVLGRAMGLPDAVVIAVALALFAIGTAAGAALASRVLDDR